jgi:hypothetical protein
LDIIPRVATIVLAAVDMDLLQRRVGALPNATAQGPLTHATFGNQQITLFLHLSVSILKLVVVVAHPPTTMDTAHLHLV